MALGIHKGAPPHQRETAKVGVKARIDPAGIPHRNAASAHALNEIAIDDGLVLDHQRQPFGLLLARYLADFALGPRQPRLRKIRPFPGQEKLRAAGSLKIVELEIMPPRLEPDLAHFVFPRGMHPIVLHEDFTVDAQAGAVIRSQEKLVHPLLFHLQLACKANSKIVAVVVKLPADQAVLQGPLAQRGQLRKVRQLPPFPQIERKLALAQFRPLGHHPHHPVHHHGVPRKGAHERVISHLAGNLKRQHLLGVRRHHSRRRDHPRILRNPLLGHALLAQRPRLLRQRQSLVPAWPCHHQVVRHVVVVDQL